MRSIFGLARHRCIVNSCTGPFVSRPTNISVLPQTSWLSSTSSFSGSGGAKRGSGRDNNSDNNNNNNNNNKISDSKKSGPKSPLRSFKRMSDAVKEKTGLFKTGKGGDKISSDRVKHDRSSKRFVLDLGNNQIARIDYRQTGPDNKIEMYHSEVPEELRGRGLGKALAKGALEQAARENMRVKLTCSYLIDFVNKSTDPKLKKPLIK